MLKIAVVDGQGGDIGREIIEAIRREIYWDIRLIALGTNSRATATMIKAGANIGATGENAITHSVEYVDLILGPVGIIIANAMNGEITAAVACAIAGSMSKKLLIPFCGNDIQIAGLDKNLSSNQMVDQLIGMIKTLYSQEKTNIINFFK